jgi:hypothetical protein
MMLVHHDDADREFAYGFVSQIDQRFAGLSQAVGIEDRRAALDRSVEEITYRLDAVRRGCRDRGDKGDAARVPLVYWRLPTANLASSRPVFTPAIVSL